MSTRSTVNSRQSLKDFTLRSLGSPVIKINITPEQLDERLSDALDWLAEFHYDFTEKVFIVHELNQQEINRGYLELPDSVVSVLRVLPPTVAGTSGSMFNAEYQIRWEDLKSYWRTGQGMVGYYITGTYIDLANHLFNDEKPIRFSVNTGRLYLETDWSNFNVGTRFVVEATQKIDPEEFPSLYNNPFLKKYYKALVKRQWGEVLSKYSDIPLVGGMKLNGEVIRKEAEAEIEKLQIELQSTWQKMNFFFLG